MLETKLPDIATVDEVIDSQGYNIATMELTKTRRHYYLTFSSGLPKYKVSKKRFDTIEEVDHFIQKLNTVVENL